MSFYRDKYLKSGHWQNLRIAALAKVDARCAACQIRDLSNDVHHLSYGESIFEVKPKQLIVLCRRCHNIAHELIDRVDKLQNVPVKKVAKARRNTRTLVQYILRKRAKLRRELQTLEELPSFLRIFTAAHQDE